MIINLVSNDHLIKETQCVASAMIVMQMHAERSKSDAICASADRLVSTHWLIRLIQSAVRPSTEIAIWYTKHISLAHIFKIFQISPSDSISLEESLLKL